MDFKIKGINHIGIASKDPQKTKEFFELLKLPHLCDELVVEQKVNTIIFDAAMNEVEGISKLEILEPTAPDSPISKYLEKKGGGIHHLALTVDDIEAAIKYLLNHDVQLIDTVPRDGAYDTKIAFVHPNAAGGILIELVQNLK